MLGLAHGESDAAALGQEAQRFEGADGLAHDGARNGVLGLEGGEGQDGTGRQIAVDDADADRVDQRAVRRSSHYPSSGLRYDLILAKI